jgi:hypothetical protein
MLQQRCVEGKQTENKEACGVSKGGRRFYVFVVVAMMRKLKFCYEIDERMVPYHTPPA